MNEYKMIKHNTGVLQTQTLLPTTVATRQRQMAIANKNYLQCEHISRG